MKTFYTSFQTTTSWKRTRMMIMKTITISIRLKRKPEWQVIFKIFCSPLSLSKCTFNNNKMIILLNLILITLKYLRIIIKCTTYHLKNKIKKRCLFQTFWLSNRRIRKLWKKTLFQIFNFQIQKGLL